MTAPVSIPDYISLTMSTIGQGGLAPTSELSKLFTIVYALLRIGVFVAVTAKLVIITVSHKKDAKAHKKHATHG